MNMNEIPLTIPDWWGQEKLVIHKFKITIYLYAETYKLGFLRRLIPDSVQTQKPRMTYKTTLASGILSN